MLKLESGGLVLPSELAARVKGHLVEAETVLRELANQCEGSAAYEKGIKTADQLRGLLAELQRGE